MKSPVALLAAACVLLTPAALPGQTLAESLDQPSFTVSTSSWQPSADPLQTHDTNDSAVCTLSSNISASLEVTITGPARISWWWRMTGNGTGNLSAYINNTPSCAPVTAAAGAWVKPEITVPPGTYQLEWRAERTAGTVSFGIDELSVQAWDGRGLAAWNDSVTPLPCGAPWEPSAVAVAVSKTRPGDYISYPQYFAVRTDGTVASWGHVQATPSLIPPPGLTNVAAIAAGSNGGLALHRNGTVTGWGAAAPVPAGITNAVQVFAGLEHYLVLGSDGHVRVWGSIATRDQFSAVVRTAAGVPAGMPRFTRVGAAGSWSLGLTTDGKIIRWSTSAGWQSAATEAALPQRFFEFNGQADILTFPLPDILVLSGLTFNGQAFRSGASTPFATNAVSVFADPSTVGMSNFPMWALLPDGTLRESLHPADVTSSIPFLAVAEVNGQKGLAVTGGATLRPEFVSADFAVAFAASPGVAPARTWYQCAVANGAQSFSATGLPPGLSLDTASGRVSGQPSLNGTYDVTFTAANPAGTGQKTVRFYSDTTPAPRVNDAPRTVTQGVPFTHSITPAGEPAAAGYAATLPAGLGLTLDPLNGIISGTPAIAGLYSIPLTATNIAGTAQGILALTVASSIPAVTGDTLTFHEGDWFYHRITADGLPHTGYNAAPLPSGLSLHAGAVSGHIPVPGQYDITLSVTNAAGTGTANLRLVVLPRTIPPVLTVNTTVDQLDTPAGPLVSLREALRDIPNGGVIQLPPALSGQPLTLTLGPLRLDTQGREVTIVTGGTGLTLSGGNTSRIFEIGAGARLNISGLIMKDGRAPDATATTGAHIASIGGGAVLNDGFFTAVDCIFSNNKSGTGFTDPVGAAQNDAGPAGGAGGGGGAIRSSGGLDLLRCRFRNNQGGKGGNGGPTGENRQEPGRGGHGGGGGAVWAESLTATDCEFVSNTAGTGGNGAPPRFGGFLVTGNGGNGGDGGAIFATNTILKNCLLASNTSGAPGPHGEAQGAPGITGLDGGTGSGGALRSTTVDFVNCTFHGNATAPAGPLTPSTSYAVGGAVSADSGRIVHCTITANAIGGVNQASPPPAAARGGGVSGTASLIIENSIIAANTAIFADGHDVFGSLTYAGANLIGVRGTIAGPLNGTATAPLAPGLLSLTWNGGLTKTMRLNGPSPARNAAIHSESTPSTDQRGYPRAAGNAPDLGALEMESTAIPSLTIRNLTLTRAPSNNYMLTWGYTAGTIQVQQSTTLASGTWTTVPDVTPTFDPDTGIGTAVIPAPAGARRYFRIVWNP